MEFSDKVLIISIIILSLTISAILVYGGITDTPKAIDITCDHKDSFNDCVEGCSKAINSFESFVTSKNVACYDEKFYVDCDNLCMSD